MQVEDCYTGFFSIVCTGDPINILYAEFGRSTCAPDQAIYRCCPSATDCVVSSEVKKGRLEDLKSECQGKASCYPRPDWHYIAECGGFSDYEVVYYTCGECKYI